MRFDSRQTQVQPQAPALPALTVRGIGPVVPDAPLHLTPRQYEVLQLLCEGLPNKLISRRLGISGSTVKIHVSCILRALRVSDRLQAVITARARGLVGEPSAEWLRRVQPVTVPAPAPAPVPAATAAVAVGAAPVPGPRFALPLEGAWGGLRHGRTLGSHG